MVDRSLASRRVRVGAVLAVVGCVFGAFLLGGKTSRNAEESAGPPGTARQPRGDPSVHRRFLLGHSRKGRPIVATQTGDRDAQRRVLVVGCIHGDEPAGIAIATRLGGARPRESQIWTVPDLNPDGVAADTRQNARGVDLNRNFPWRWSPSSASGSQQYPGVRPLSEPESRLARALILKLRPHVTIWFHQPLGITDRSGGDPAIERRFAASAGLPLRRLTRYHGSAAGWQNHRLPGTTAFVAELPPGDIGVQRIARYSRAVVLLADVGRNGKHALRTPPRRKPLSRTPWAVLGSNQ